MIAVFRQEGNAIDYIPAADVAAGDVVVLGQLIGVAKLDIAANSLGALALVGVFTFPKTAGVGTAIAPGAKLYWDVAEQVAKEDDEAGANAYLGKAVAAAGDDDETVPIRLEQ